MILAAWLHNLDPVFFELGPLPIRWYGLSYLAGFLVAYLIIKRVSRVGVSSLKPDHVADLVVAVAVGIFVGGRLGYVLLYQPSLMFEFTGAIPYWGLLAINQGGMASHGGMLGGILGCVYYAHRHKHDPLFMMDLFAFGAPLGVFFGRIANFINGELYGRPCDPMYPLAVKFPHELQDMSSEQVYEVYAALPPPDSVVPGLAAWTDGVVLALIQGGNAVVSSAVDPYLTPRHPSQLYAGVMEGLVVLAVLSLVWMKPRKPGLIAGAFCITYAVMRIINEFFRMPDVHLLDQEFAAWNVTRGQWLSALLMIVGVSLSFYVLKRASKPTGGWLSMK